MNVKQLIQDYLKEAKLMQLATSVNNQPWVCSVWFAPDEELNLYWFSSQTRRHSQEVITNDKVAGAIALPHTPDDKPRGVQFQGVTRRLTAPEDIERAKKYYAGRIFTEERIDEFMKEHAHNFYQIEPSLFVLFDVVNFPDNPRQELKL